MTSFWIKNEPLSQIFIKNDLFGPNLPPFITFLIHFMSIKLTSGKPDPLGSATLSILYLWSKFEVKRSFAAQEKGFGVL